MFVAGSTHQDHPVAAHIAFQVLRKIPLGTLNSLFDTELASGIVCDIIHFPIMLTCSHSSSLH